MSKPQSLESARVMDDVGMKLLRAAEIIRERGWCQGKAQIEDRVCLHRAIAIAHGMRMSIDLWPNCIREIERVSKAVGVPVTDGQGKWTVVKWQDAPERTAAEVISALTSAAFQEGEGK